MMDADPSRRDRPPIPRPGADTNSRPILQSFKEEKVLVTTAVTERRIPLHQASSESMEAQPASTSGEPLLKLQDHPRREAPETRSTLVSVKNEESIDKHFPGMGEGSHSMPTDGLGDVEMRDSTANDGDDSEVEDDADDADDADFHSGSDSDSDGSEEDGGRGKHQRPKAGTAASSQASAFLQTIKSLQDQLLARKMSQGLTGDEPQMLEQLEKQLSEAQNQLDQDLAIKEEEPAKKKKKRRSLVKTAREYWQRELEEEAEREAKREAKEEEKKRKCQDEAEGPNKARKTATEHPPRQSTKHSASTARASMLHSLGNMDQSVHDGNVPTMGAIQARTHGDQFKQIMKGMPDGFDSRRAKTQPKDFRKAVSSFGFKKVEAFDGTWKLKGMTTGLLNYQIVVSAWMAKREAQKLHPAGGLLADDMGMGKTITTIACIVGHPPESEDLEEFSRATLVVVNNHQNAVQWSQQIEKHCVDNFFGKTDIFAKDRLNWNAARWGKLNVVQDLRGKWAGDPAGFEKALQRKLGKLFKVNWYRVVLDEAHAIKNRTSSSE
ncbi:hypothetical protein N0V84_006000 [Fusarium piperis]|uniref:SNF2 N-terminal domain-containing protein n=1 Tax=Fusarium piperis TaxID=1435070 RepID=A0A9W8WCQ9_9HYPO|nr:hypothetical protein N0V84_006000 [Fusarium piperis]